jgi:hypothetical protein
VRLAVRKIARGEPARLPARYQLVLVAAAHGVSIDEVRDWPADDVADALNMYPITGGRHGK